MNPPYRVRIADWTFDQEKLRAVREMVFVVEQSVPRELEWDAEDPRCVHVIAETEEGVAIGTGRLLPDGHIGRMAVSKEWRRRGVGSAVLALLLDRAKQAGHKIVRLHAQSYVLAFYEQHGFIAESEEFLEVDIPHRKMTRPL
jgi:predicted GNAT family N-acyltransferase